MVHCSVYGCNSSSGQEVSFFSFPNAERKPYLREAWLRRINRKNFTPRKGAKVCSRHFSPEDMDDSVALKRELMPGAVFKPKLKDMAVPSILLNGETQSSESKRKSRKMIGSPRGEEEEDIVVVHEAKFLVKKLPVPMVQEEEEDDGRDGDMETMEDVTAMAVEVAAAATEAEVKTSGSDGGEDILKGERSVEKIPREIVSETKYEDDENLLENLKSIETELLESYALPGKDNPPLFLPDDLDEMLNNSFDSVIVEGTDPTASAQDDTLLNLDAIDDELESAIMREFWSLESSFDLLDFEEITGLTENARKTSEAQDSTAKTQEIHSEWQSLEETLSTLTEEIARDYDKAQFEKPSPITEPTPPVSISPEATGKMESGSAAVGNLPRDLIIKVTTAGPEGYSSKYVCHVCDKTFRAPSFLRIHQRTHTGEKPFKCEWCDKRCSDPSNLSKHERVHYKRFSNKRYGDMISKLKISAGKIVR